jgi:hypothetical protein
MQKEHAVGLVESDTPDAKFTPTDVRNKTRVKGERLKLDEAATTAFAEGYCTRQRCLHRLHSVQSYFYARLDMACKVKD